MGRNPEIRKKEKFEIKFKIKIKMNARGRNSNRGHRRTQSMIVDQRIRQLERRLTGHKTTPALNPPAFVQRPWNSWTFEQLDTTTTDLQGSTVTVATILAQIRARLALTEQSDIRIKVQSSQVWCTASGLVYPDLEATFYELSGEVAAEQFPRSTQRDKGTLNAPARCGYSYPSADRRDILGTPNAALSVVTGVATEAGSNITFRVQVLWQTST